MEGGAGYTVGDWRNQTNMHATWACLSQPAILNYSVGETPPVHMLDGIADMSVCLMLSVT
jgi:hypothetical protein